MTVAATVLAIAAVVLVVVAIAGMVTGNDGGRRGWTLRALAVACFAAAVVINALR